MKLEDLEIYRIATEVSKEAWEEYEKMGWQTKKIIGDQFISAIDSIGANIAEGYGRYHFHDKNKFYYNARGSLFESLHWLKILALRGIVDVKKGEILRKKLEKLCVKLNNYIASTRRQTD